MEFISHSVYETEEIGRLLAAQLKKGDVIAYTGDLGAGKTAFTRGLALGLRITERVTSPTYTIVNEYLSGRLPLFHFDIYRLASTDDLYDIGLDDYLARGGVCAVEWSENASDAFDSPICVDITRLGEDMRKITITGGDDLAPFSL